MASNELFDAASFLYVNDLIDEDDFLLVANECELKAPVFPYWKYQHFTLEEVNDEECLSDFHFKKEDLPRIARVLRIPQKVACENETVADQLEGLCIFSNAFYIHVDRVI